MIFSVEELFESGPPGDPSVSRTQSKIGIQIDRKFTLTSNGFLDSRDKYNKGDARRNCLV